MRTDFRPVVASETERLQATITGLDDISVAQESRCVGWSRGHVLTHLARNADALGRLVANATTGSNTPMYPSAEIRDAEINAGSTRSLRELADDIHGSAGRLAEGFALLTGPVADTSVEMRGGTFVAAGFLPFLRLREVVLHHVDLGAGYGFTDIPDDVAAELLRDAVKRLSRVEQAPGVTLRSDDGDEYSIGDGHQVLEGSRAALLGWLAREEDLGVRSAAPLPALPFGG